MPRIYCVIGKSGTGKDTLMEYLLNNESHDLKKIIPYTTRPMRENEINGVNYYYVSESEMNKMDTEGRIIEKRCYHTVHGDWYYFTSSDNISEDKKNIIITTQEALKYFFEKYGMENIYVIYLKLDDKIRLERCINRESQQTEPNYKEVCRRFLADENDFDEEEINNYKNVKILDTSSDVDTYITELKNFIIWNKLIHFT